VKEVGGGVEGEEVCCTGSGPGRCLVSASHIGSSVVGETGEKTISWSSVEVVEVGEPGCVVVVRQE